MKKDSLLVWVFVLAAIALNIFLTFYIWNNRIPIIDNIHYGKYIFKRGFLVLVSAGAVFYYLIPLKKFGGKLKANLASILIIFAVLLIARALSFGGWFGGQDARTFTEGPDLQYVENPYYPMLPYYLARHLFGTNFVGYNALGLLSYFLAGLVLYWLINWWSENKLASLLGALFLATTPTFFNDTLNMTEFMGDGFALFFFLVALYFLAKKFYAGSVLLAATAFEFGISRTSFTVLPLSVAAFLFFPKFSFKKITLPLILALVLWPLLFLFNNWTVFYYSPTHFNNFANPLTNYPLQEVILKFFTTILGTSIPHQFLPPLLKLVEAPVLGFLFILSIGLLGLVFWKKNNLVAKMLLLGLVVACGSAIAPTLYGLGRLMQDVTQLTSQFRDNLPTSYTVYGTFPAFGMALVITALYLSARSVRTKAFAFLLICLVLTTNAVFFIRSEQLVVRKRARPLKQMISQLSVFLPDDGKVKLVFVPENQKDRALYDALNTYTMVFFRGRIILRTDSPSDFVKLRDKNSLTNDQLYFLARSRSSYLIYNFSGNLRAVPKNSLANRFPDLIEKSQSLAK